MLNLSWLLWPNACNVMKTEPGTEHGHPPSDWPIFRQIRNNALWPLEVLKVNTTSKGSAILQPNQVLRNRENNNFSFQLPTTLILMHELVANDEAHMTELSNQHKVGPF